MNGISPTIGALGGSGGTLQISGSGNLTAGTYTPAITMSNNATLEYSSSANQTLGGLISGAGGLTKDTSSSSTLTLSNGASSYTGNISITGGTLLATGTTGGVNPTTGSLGNPQTASRTITVGTGAALSFGNNDILGNHASSPVVKLVVNGGTFTNNGNFFTTLGAVDLNAGTINSTGGANLSFPSFSLRGPVTVGGSATSTIGGAGANSQMVVGVNTAGSQTTFNVADATGDSVSDLNVTVLLQNNRDGAGAEVATGIVKSGAGTMTLTEANTFTGLTSVQEGALVLTGSLSGSVNVANGATFDVAGVGGGFVLGAAQTLSGTGSVVGGTTVNGTLSPGNSIGTLSFSSSLALGGTSAFEISKTGFTLASDLAAVSGALTLGGTLNVTASGDALAFGDTFDLFNAPSFSGAFATLNLPVLDPGLEWNTANLGTDGSIAVVPEPGSALLLVAECSRVVAGAKLVSFL